MPVIAYCYSVLPESVPDAAVWATSADRLYQDIGGRQQWHELLQACQHTPVDYLLIRRFAELGDSAEAVAEALSQLKQLNVPLIATEEPIDTRHQKMRGSDLLHLLQSIQQQRHDRLRQGHARNRLKALPPPGKAPYGYRRGKDRYLLDRTTAPVVREFFDDFLLYGSLRGSVRHLQKKFNKRISASTGKRWLSSAVYRGDLLYQTGEVVRDTHAAILTRDEAAQIDRLLRRNRRMPPRTASAPRSLSGLVSCGSCQSSMQIARVAHRRQQSEYLYLRPVSCPNQPKCRSIAYDEVLQQTIQQICQELPAAVSDLQLPDLEGIKAALQAEINAKQAIINQIPALLESGILDDETAALRVYKLRTEMAAIADRQAQLPPVNLKTIAQVVSISQFWLDLSEAERRFYFREFIRQIEILREDRSWQLQLSFIF